MIRENESDKLWNCLIFILIILIMFEAAKFGVKDKETIQETEQATEIVNAEEIKTEVISFDVPFDVKRMADVKLNVKEEIEQPDEVKQVIMYDLSDDEKYLLAKLAMTEAGNQNTQTKSLVIYTVLNRVESGLFEDTIEGVIFQNNGKVWQFSPIHDGSWEKVEPDADCYEALEAVLSSPINYSYGALYFESDSGNDTWHSKHLEYLYTSDEMKFYR